MVDTKRQLSRLMRAVGTSLTKTDRAHRVLRVAIVEGILWPGASLHTEALAQTFGMSRIPVREALRRLEQEGLVDIRPHIGATVHEPPRNEIKENLVIRSELEALATRLACPSMDEPCLRELERLLEAMDACVVDGDPEAYRHLNRTFHMTIYRANPYQRLVNLIEQLWVLLSRSRSIFALDPSYMECSQVEHWRLFTALRMGDADTAEQVIREHKLNGMRAFDRIASAPGQPGGERVKRAIEDASPMC